MAYSGENIIEKVNAALMNPATLCAEPFVNYRGSFGGVRYTETAAREISRPKNLAAFCGMSTISREKSYKTESHKELANRIKPENSNRDEEWIAISMYGKTFDGIGEIIDFQTPLKNTANDRAGKIDLLSFNKAENVAFTFEFKKPGNKDTLLHCVLQSYTNGEIVDGDKLLRDFCIEGAELRKAVLIFKSCAAYAEFLDDDFEAVRSIMRDILHVDLFVLNDDWSEVIDGYIH